MVKISEFGEDFFLLAFRIDKHIKGYVDFYFGPKKLQNLVKNEALKSPHVLLNHCKVLLNELLVQGYDKNRVRYLEKLLIAMKTSAEMLSGVNISIEDQFLKLYDVILQSVNEDDLDKLKEEIVEAYPSPGSLEEKMIRLSTIRKVPKFKIIDLFEKALKITKQRTKEIFIDLLPEDESIAIELVNDNRNEVKWSYYEWYLGNFNSQLDINPNYDIFWTSFLSVAAHEGYPGHHTEFAVKEERLYRELNQFEHSILLVHSPRLIISEGIADIAINMLFDYQEQAEISLRELCPSLAEDESIDILTAQNKVRGKMKLFLYNFAYHALIDEWSEEKLIEYGNKFGVYNNENLHNQLKMISNPVYSKNAFMYNLGKNLILEKFGRFPSIKHFQDLLVNPILPSDLI